jgi:hypothetical protein
VWRLNDPVTRVHVSLPFYLYSITMSLYIYTPFNHSRRFAMFTAQCRGSQPTERGFSPCSKGSASPARTSRAVRLCLT